MHSHLTYCTSILNSITIANKSCIEKVQKKAIRIMTGSSYNAHTAPLFQQHAILPFDKLILQAQLSFMHSKEYQYAPRSFINIWPKIGDREPYLNLRNANDFYLPIPRTETFKNLHTIPCHLHGMSYYLKSNYNRTKLPLNGP